MNKLRITSLILFTTSLFTLSSCDNNCIKGNGDIVTKTLDVKPFNSIVLETNANVVISQGETQDVKVTTSSNMIESIKTDVTDSTWLIDFHKGCFSYKEMIFEITVPKIKNVITNGTGKIKINNFDIRGNLSVTTNGTGLFELHSLMNTNLLDINIAGTGDINIVDSSSSVNKIMIDISGTGNVRSFPYTTNQCLINISGTGNCEVNVNDDLNINISGTGNIYYKGHPNIEKNISGTGNVYDKND